MNHSSSSSNATQDRAYQIIRTSWIGIIANVLLAGFKAAVGILASSVAIVMDVIPDVTVHDDAAFVRQLLTEIQPLVPETQVDIIVDHNYSEND